ncbi:MAG: PfaD family polyunsaturated fatty acid/polyketide biosynthesis protein [Myxococcales bacterium]
MERIREPLRVVRKEGRFGVLPADGSALSARTELVALLPALYPEWLGDRGFCEAHQVRFPYCVGEMANELTTTRMVIAAARAGFLGFFGAAGLTPERLDAALGEIERELGTGPSARSWGSNLIHSPAEPALEDAVVDVYLRRDVRRVSASAFMSVTPAVVRYSATGLTRDGAGRIRRRNHLFAKISRPETARLFLSPAPKEILSALVAQKKLTAAEAELAALLPLAEDVTVEADSGGHTDNRPLGAIFPAVALVLDELVARHRYPRPVRLGAAGGLGTPSSVAAAFALGASYVMTGSVNQAAVESGLGESGKKLLAQAGIADVAMAPAADMFELGVKVQVLKRGTLFAPRADKLFALYQKYASLEELPQAERARLENEILRLPVDEVWKQTAAFWQKREPAEPRARREGPAPQDGARLPLVPGPGQSLGHPRPARATARLPDLDRARHRRLQRLGQGQLPRGPRPPRRRPDWPQPARGRGGRHPRPGAARRRRPRGTGRLRLPPPTALLKEPTSMPKTSKTKTPRSAVSPSSPTADAPSTPGSLCSPSAREAGVAVVGLSALFPGSVDETGFWHDILAGRDLIRDVPPTHWLKDDYYDADPLVPDKTYATRGAFLDHVDFDALGFGVPPNVVPATDTAQLLSLIVAQRVLDEVSAASPARKVAKDRISVILGVTSGQELLSSMASRLQRPVWVKALREAGLPESKVQEACDRITSHYTPWQENTFPGLLGNVVAGRIANRFDTGGTNCVTDAACASSFAAISMAVNELVLGQSDLVVTGGVDTLNDIFMYMCFAKTQALSKAGDCRPFSDEADGTLLGEGLCMLALKRLGDAEKDGDRIYAILRGVGSSSDGRAKSVYAPRPEGQAKAIARAYEAAGYGPETVELVEAHGTGTKAGDVAEFEGLQLAFDASQRADRQWCALGSVKSQIGHTKAAAGAAGLFKAVMALVHGALPPTLKVARPNPKLALEKSPFYLNTATRPWVRGSSHPRRVGVSSFGFGGSNFHLTLEEYRGPGQKALRKRTAAAELLTFGAATAEALVQTLRSLAIGSGSLKALARSTQERCPANATVRLGLVATDEKDLAAKVTTAIKTLQAKPDQPFSAPGIHYSPVARDGKVAFLFPGQGSQHVGMGGSLATFWREALDAWDQAADVVHDGTRRLQDVVFPRPAFTDEERAAQTKLLTRTEWAQPAIGAASLAQLKLLSAIGLKPDAVAGHSFGEVTALFAAGTFNETTFLQVARRRGELMAEAAQLPGAMTAALAPLAEIEAALKEAPEARIANYNAPAQTVVCGTVAAIEQAEAAFAKHGIRFQRLDVATAFHSPIVAGSQKPFEAFLNGAEIGKPGLPVFSNSEATPYPADAAKVRSLLASQLARPVRFVESIEAMYATGVRTFVEVGPGTTLTGLVERILAGRPFVAVSLDAKGKDGVAAFHEGLAKLFAAGCAMNLGALWAEFQPVVDPSTVKKPVVSIPICGANHGKPYPPAKGAAALPPPNPEIAPSVPVAAAPATSPAAGTPLTPNVSASMTANPSWLTAYQQAQRDTLEAHTAWQKAMTETHTAYLKAVERSFEAVAAAAAGAPLPAALPVTAFVAPPLPATPAPVPAPAAIAQPVAVPAPVAPVAAPAPAPAKQVDLKALLLEVVSAKTGYPAEMLNVDLSLEADLGIDSIKRVEILSALRERVPELPEVKPAAMASLKTLGAIIEFAQSSAPVASAAAPPPAPAAAKQLDLKALLLEVVSAKTGYPAEMLNVDLSLEADLGIDSIKRVEILSALRERVPELPEVKPAAMASLKTLGAIIEFAQSSAPAAASTPSTPSAPSTPSTSSSRTDLKALLLQIVAAKTGYPGEMLGMDLSLEADLGIDSIKRVEILSAMREQVPDLPEVKPAAMAGLKTLGSIVAFLEGGGAHEGQQPEQPKKNGASAHEAPAPVLAKSLERCVVRAIEGAAPGLGLPGLSRLRRLAIVPNENEVAQALQAALRARGIAASLEASVPADADGVLFVGGLTDLPSADVVRAGFRAARAAAPQLSERPGVFVTVQDTGGDFGLSGNERAELGGLAGIAKTAAMEWPQASVKAIDLERGSRPPQALAAALLQELLEGGDEREVGLCADGRRLVPVAVPEPVGEPAAKPVLDSCSVVVATGGARGVTAACLVALARRTKARFLLLGRTALAEEPACCRSAKDGAALKRALLEDAKASGRSMTPAELLPRRERRARRA